jgi:ketosteroid isomerase-like protein
MQKYLVSFISASLFGLAAFAQQSTARPDEQAKAAIELTVNRFLDGWNKHDAHAFAMTFTEDADFTNVQGMHANGRSNVEAFHA